MDNLQLVAISWYEEAMLKYRPVVVYVRAVESGANKATTVLGKARHEPFLHNV